MVSGYVGHLDCLLHWSIGVSFRRSVDEIGVAASDFVLCTAHLKHETKTRTEDTTSWLKRRDLTRMYMTSIIIQSRYNGGKECVMEHVIKR